MVSMPSAPWATCSGDAADAHSASADAPADAEHGRSDRHRAERAGAVVDALDEGRRVGGQGGLVLLVIDGQRRCARRQDVAPCVGGGRGPTEAAQVRVERAKDRPRVVWSGEELADRRQQRPVGVEDVEGGERKRRQRRKLTRRGRAERVGAAAEGAICRGTIEDAATKDDSGPRRDRGGQQRLPIAEVARDDPAVSAPVGATRGGDRPRVGGVAPAARAGEVEAASGVRPQPVQCSRASLSARTAVVRQVNAKRPTARP
jgi:hypothetical protein